MEFKLDTSKDYVCKRIRLYNYLSERGVYPIEHKVDKDNPKFYVWFYKSTEELGKLINSYYNRVEYINRM